MKYKVSVTMGLTGCYKESLVDVEKDLGYDLDFWAGLPEADQNRELFNMAIQLLGVEINHSLVED